jgi:hypothetical protein
MNKFCICWFFTRILMKCTVQEAKSPVKNLVRQRCAGVFNSIVNGLIYTYVQLLQLNTTTYVEKTSYSKGKEKYVCCYIEGGSDVFILDSSEMAITFRSLLSTNVI